MTSKILVLNGPRQANLYELAESLVSKYQVNVLSTLAAILTRPARVVVPDLGLPAELEMLIKTFGAGNIQIVHVVRDGCTFDGDPRQYVDHADVEALTLVYSEQTNGLTLGLVAYIFFEVSKVKHAGSIGYLD